MRNYKHYNRYEKESKVFAAAALLVMLALIVLIIMQICGLFDEPLWKPTVEYPMVNQNISWEQSYHGGAWNE